jgi:hypothetical protein
MEDPEQQQNSGAGAGADATDINNYDLDDEFPDYANEQNKELNQIVLASFPNSFLGEGENQARPLAQH